ncbi:MAG: SIS domain-containing protein [Clostridia bacterium]
MKSTPFLEEVIAQPQALRDLVSQYQRTQFAPLLQAQALLASAKRVIFSGMGTSYSAPLLISDQLRQRGYLHIEAGELYEYNRSLLTHDTLCVFLSQSGESIEIKRLLDVLPDGCRVLAITNEPGSTLGKAGEQTLLLFGGHEATITNRTFTNTLALLQLLFAPEASRNQMAAQLLQVADQMEALCASTQALEAVDEAAAWLAPAHQAYFIGRGGAGMVCASQAALIFTEGARCAGRGLSTGAFHHGPMEICGAEHRAVVFGQEDAYLPKTLNLCERMAALQSHVIYVGHAQPADCRCIPLPAVNSAEYPFLAAMAFELLLTRVAALKGLEAGNFRIGNKITVED